MNKYLIGLTGNIAAGKSTVGQMLRELGAAVIDADALTHELQRKGTPTYAAIIAAFGESILAESGEIDRSALGAIVFASPDRLRTLEQIMHPAVAIESQYRILAAPENIVVYEAVKLIEAGRAAMCDAIWVVIAQPDVQLKRLMRDRHLRSRCASAPRVAAATQREGQMGQCRHRQQRVTGRDTPAS
ncbi:MAG TPA: dephospho-CoA kinase [Anaerolineae bacterium]